MSINVNDKSNTTFYFTAPLFLPCTIEDPNFLGVYSSTSTLPTTANNFNTAGVAGTGSMYVYLNSAWQYIGQYLYDAYRYLVYYQGSSFALASGTKWTSIFNDIASNSSLMNEFIGNTNSLTNLTNSSIAMNVIAGSSSAMQLIGNSTTAMSAILPSSAYKETWWNSSYYVGLGLNTYAGLNNSTLAGLSTVSNIVTNSTAMSAIASSSTAMNAIASSSTVMNAVAASSTAMNTVTASSTAMNAVAASSTAMNAVAASSTAMNAVAASSTAMNAVAASSTAMNAVAASSTAMNAVIASYTAMNAMTTLTAKNALQSASTALSSIQTLVSNINSGSIVLGGGTAGSSSALGLNALLVLLSYDNGAAVPAGSATSSPSPTLASKMYAAYSPTQNTYSSSYNISYPAVILVTNQIVFAVGIYSNTSGNAVGLGNLPGYSTTGTNASNIIYTTATSIQYPNKGTSPLLLSGTLYVEVQGSTAYYYYLTYTPS